MKPVLVLSCFLIVGCGSDPVGDSTGSGSVPSSLNPFSSGGHSCTSPVLSGSPEQKACFAEAQEKCPEGMTPSQVEFEQQPDGQFLIKGYACA